MWKFHVQMYNIEMYNIEHYRNTIRTSILISKTETRNQPKYSNHLYLEIPTKRARFWVIGHFTTKLFHSWYFIRYFCLCVPRKGPRSRIIEHDSNNKLHDRKSCFPINRNCFHRSSIVVELAVFHRELLDIYNTYIARIIAANRIHRRKISPRWSLNRIEVCSLFSLITKVCEESTLHQVPSVIKVLARL